ncbi:hypothetical protein Tco_0180842 [Tanacetum coccineum]
MEVFTLILQNQISDDGKFKYHWGCKDLKISHIRFADDLLVLFHDDINSVKVVKRDLDKFSSISSLNPNIGKSIVFFGNVKDQVRQEILSLLPFKFGSLLIDKVKLKVSNWKNKMLSYASRLQLIASILSSMRTVKSKSKGLKVKAFGKYNVRRILAMDGNKS